MNDRAMITDNSFGIIPVRKSENGWEVLIILHRGGRHWGFPKGHAENDETPHETAKREFSEETGLTVVKILSEEEFVEQYDFFSRGHKINKTVNYYVAEVQGVISLQANEVKDSKWVPLLEAPKHLTFPQARALCRKALGILTGN